ncbi:efflux RND transporter periplasmic adaptor subunit [Desulforhopalus sp. IMCC35007]|uniref:efflux RND transporter periplasmic adaptor subunit n=1 Tax=Desulforhopalus sp. IMCC35007 TaxID=2569543 RepID=UPI0010ADEFDA|nr:efflux RND transporter periplasmic adaptor subunit [Desulforhopalus sp. IMCC35007]TKB06038.1 efflux RND transporter periplasmic adaptor subunit [Desulforhopalus sp. IMCC35007]
MQHRIHHITVFLFSLFFVIASSPVLGEDLTEFEGLIEPFELINVGTPVEGVVAQINVQRSSSVQKGESLILLESSVENAVVDRAEVMATVEGELRLQQEKLAYAELMHKRVQELFVGEAISAEKYDQAAAEVKFARAQLQKAKENRSLAHLDLARAKAMLHQRTIKSPISGIVVERFVSPGEFVDSQPLLRVAQMDPLRVEVILPAEMFRKIKPGMKAEVVPETDPNGKYSSTVAIVDRIIDPKSGTFGVRLELPNPDYRLPSGLKCTVRFLGGENTASPNSSSRTYEGDKVAKVSDLEPLPVHLTQ